MLVATPTGDASSGATSKKLSATPLKLDGDGTIPSQMRRALQSCLSRVIELFRQFDDDASGYIDGPEFVKALAELGFDPDEPSVSALFASFDADDSGTIEYEELHNLLVRSVQHKPELEPLELKAANRIALRKKRVSKVDANLFSGLELGSLDADTIPGAIRKALDERLVRVIDLFRQFDDDSSGLLDASEFAKAMRELGMADAPPEAIAAVFASFDHDESGTIEYRELHAIIKRSLQDRPVLAPLPLQTAHRITLSTKRVLKANANLLGGLDLDEAALHSLPGQIKGAMQASLVRVVDLFRQFDDDRDGRISFDEFGKAMGELGLDVLPKALRLLFDEWDPDTSGYIEYEELYTLLRHAKVVEDAGRSADADGTAAAEFSIHAPKAAEEKAAAEKAATKVQAAKRGKDGRVLAKKDKASAAAEASAMEEAEKPPAQPKPPSQPMRPGLPPTVPPYPTQPFKPLEPQRIKSNEQASAEQATADTIQRPACIQPSNQAVSATRFSDAHSIYKTAALETTNVGQYEVAAAIDKLKGDSCLSESASRGNSAFRSRQPQQPRTRVTPREPIASSKLSSKLRLAGRSSSPCSANGKGRNAFSGNKTLFFQASCMNTSPTPTAHQCSSLDESGALSICTSSTREALYDYACELDPRDPRGASLTSVSSRGWGWAPTFPRAHAAARSELSSPRTGRSLQSPRTSTSHDDRNPSSTRRPSHKSAMGSPRFPYPELARLTPLALQALSSELGLEPRVMALAPLVWHPDYGTLIRSTDEFLSPGRPPLAPRIIPRLIAVPPVIMPRLIVPRSARQRRRRGGAGDDCYGD
jgi:Ca2+-binding EF-hand superfamily protein